MYTIQGSLNELGRKLPKQFVKTHKSYIVNFNNISIITKAKTGVIPYIFLIMRKPLGLAEINITKLSIYLNQMIFKH